MTVVAVPAKPPRPGVVLSRLVETTPLSATAAVSLYEATLSDIVRAVATSGGDLLVNYRPAESLPEAETDTDDAEDAEDPETAVRSLVEAALADLEGDPHAGEPRYEPQVGSTAAARVGNTVTHLLEREGVGSAAVLWPTAPLAGRTAVDGAAMKLRDATTVLGPTATGDVYYAGFTEPVDFEGALTAPAVETVTDRTADAGGQADFLDVVPSVATPSGLATTVSLVRARERAGQRVPSYTAAAVGTLGLRTRETGGSMTVRVSGD